MIGAKLLTLTSMTITREVTRMCSDTAAYTRTTHGYCDVLHTAEYLGTNGNIEEVPGTTGYLVKEGDHI